jgi:hypothetical protein
MKKVPVSELEGAELDYAVAKAEGLPGATIYHDQSGSWCAVAAPDTFSGECGFHPSTEWFAGGNIIEREGISIVANHAHQSGVWAACIETKGPTILTASTPLIAAMRAFVASKLGDVVEVPV